MAPSRGSQTPRRAAVRPGSLLALVLGAGLIAAASFRPMPAGAADDPPDAWASGEWSARTPTVGEPDGAAYVRLSGRSAGRHLEIRWEPDEVLIIDQATAWVSTDASDAHTVRDWRTFPMQRAGGAWIARIALRSIEVPTVYFVQSQQDGRSTASPPRIFRPRAAGWEGPTYPFGGYLDGFEEGTEGWELVAGGGAHQLTLSTNALSGRGALSLQVPSGRGSVTVGSARLRGWMLTEHRPRAVRLAVRTEFGTGRVHLSLHSRARTPDLGVHPAAWGAVVDDHWRRIEIPLGDFASLRAAQVDWMTLQFFADSGTTLLVDDVELVMR